MKVLFHLGHPAHFHLFKNVITELIKRGHQTYILIKKKDVLEDLLKESGFEYSNILPQGRKDNRFSIFIGQLKQNFRLFNFCLFKNLDILVGTSVSISHVGKILKIPSVIVNEDDSDAVPLFAKLAYPWASSILAPKVCDVGEKWIGKTIFYEGYHELAYLHPNNFTPQKSIVEKYFSVSERYFIIRFAKLGAHHDDGVSGITDEIALKLIKILKPFGNVFITSERRLIKDLDMYRVNISPSDIHHVMAFSSLYIGDSQTMAAESGVLGIPFIRFNDFVGRISYLEELELKYKLGYGINTNKVDLLYKTLNSLLNEKNRSTIFQLRRHEMLSDKLDLSAFMTWFIENYPNSINKLKITPEYQLKFKGLI